MSEENLEVETTETEDEKKNLDGEPSSNQEEISKPEDN